MDRIANRVDHERFSGEQNGARHESYGVGVQSRTEQGNGVGAHDEVTICEDQRVERGVRRRQVAAARKSGVVCGGNDA